MVHHKRLLGRSGLSNHVHLEAREAEPQVVTSVVFVTAPQTFSGPATFSTMGVVGPPVQASSSQRQAPTTQQQQQQQQTSVQQQDTSTQSAGTTSSTSTSSSSTTTSSTSSSTTSTSSSQTSSSASQSNSSPTYMTTSSSSSSPTAISSTSSTSGMTGGAKAGLVLGLLLGLIAVLSLVLVMYRRKRKQNEEYAKMNDEKNNSNGGALKSHFSHDGSTYGGRASSVRTAKTASTAPRLSLRPVTQFLPNLAGDRKSQGNQLAMTSGAGAQRSLSPNSQNLAVPQSQPMRQTAANDPANPFGNHAESSLSPSVPPKSSPLGLPSIPTPPKGLEPDGRDLAAAMLTGTAVVAGAAAVGGAAAAAASHHQQQQRGPSPSPAPKPEPEPSQPDNDRAMNEKSPLSPTGTVFSQMSEVPPTPIAAVAGGVGSAAALPRGPPPDATGPPVVHRVQLDFKPSMEDELELRAGQLVRLLHEYDDGWALCIRLDRSQQGVAPRTCLSVRPVKPAGRPPGPNSPRGGPPPGMMGSPRGPGPQHQGRMGPPPQNRSMSPAPPSGRGSPSPYGRSQSPMRGPNPNMNMPMSSGRNSPGPYAQQQQQGPPRSMSPAGGPRSRSNSAASGMGPRPPVGPGPGPSRMNPGRSQSPAPGMLRKPVPGQAM